MRSTVNDETEKAYTLLIKLINILGWDVAIPSGGGPEDDEKVHGMIIGEKSYVDFILKHLD